MCPLENNGRVSSMKNSKIGLRGVSLLEVTIAVLIFFTALVPIYKILTTQSASEIETTKIAMAKDILNSLRQEILSHTFADIEKQVPTSADGGELQGEPYPITLKRVLDAQKRYKDFDMKVLASFSDSLKKTVIFTGLVTWTDNKEQKKTETLNFIQISQE